MTERTRRGARLVEVAERDPVAERDAELASLFGTYNEIVEAAWEDYLGESRAAWDRYRSRLDGATADYQSHVERVRSEP